MSVPSLSVVMSNYNHGKYIARAIEAVVSQSRQPDEYIILDDGSTDNSPEIIESYAKRYSYIRFIRNKHNRGVVKSFNHIIRMASGDYIYAAGADDYILPGFFEKTMGMAEHYPHAGLIFGKAVYVNYDDEELYVSEASRWKQPLFASPDIFLRDYINAEGRTACISVSTIFKRNNFEEVGYFREELSSRCDLFAIHAIGLKNGACYIPERLTAMSYNYDSVSETSRRNLKEMLDIIARMAWLMKSPEFRDRFPEKHVQEWEKSYRNELVHEYYQNIISSFNAISTKLYYGFSFGNRMDKYLSFILMKCFGFYKKILVAYLKHVLNNYKGDISCYMR